MKLFEYDLKIHHVSNKNLTIANDLFRLINYLFYHVKSKKISLTILIVKRIDNFTIDNSFEMSFQFYINDDQLSNFFIQKINVDKKKRYNRLWKKWQKWTKNSWYQHIMKYLKTNELQKLENFVEFEFKIIKTKTKRYILMKRQSLTIDIFIRKQLIFRKRNEYLTEYFHSNQIRKTLKLLHDIHEHFVIDITMQKTIKNFYWFIKRKNVIYYCRTCVICQKFEFLKFTQRMLSILFLQFFNYVNIDYIESINSIFKMKKKYICFCVKYMIKFLFAKIITNAIAHITLNFFERKIINVFEWSRTIYKNNNIHFENVFTEKTISMNIKTIKISIYYSFFVDLIERMTQLIKIILKILLQHVFDYILKWNLFLKYVVESIITRHIKIYEYFSTQLLYEFQFKIIKKMKNFENQFRYKFFQSIIIRWTKNAKNITNEIYATRLNVLNEMRNFFLNKRFKKQQKIVFKMNKKNISFVKENLIMIRKLTQIKNHTNSLTN